MPISAPSGPTPIPGMTARMSSWRCAASFGRVGKRTRWSWIASIRLRRCIQGSPHRARRTFLQVARAAQRRAFAAERSGDPAGGNIGQGPGLRGQVCRRDLRDPAAGRRCSRLFRGYQGADGGARARPGGMQDPVRLTADHRRNEIRGARPAGGAQQLVPAEGGMAIFPPTWTSICPGCRPTP